ncbi:MAG: hypothetical protein ACLPTJ_00825 [Solirubrobacteraceae bacterium]
MIAAERWPKDGEPANPARGWSQQLATARFERIRRDRTFAAKAPLLVAEQQTLAEVGWDPAPSSATR